MKAAVGARRVCLQIWSQPAPADGRFEVLTFTAGRSGHVVQRSLGADPPLVLAALVTSGLDRRGIRTAPPAGVDRSRLVHRAVDPVT